MKVQTHCKNCTFIERDSTRQTGCVLKRDEKLGVCGNDSENNFVGFAIHIGPTNG